MGDDRSEFPRSILWRRIDVEGMDACSFARSDDGYVIFGTALFQDPAGPAKIDYAVCCNSDWASRSARVSGWIGSSKKELELLRGPEGQWSVQGQYIGGVEGLLDVDLGFTPATNTNAINRMELRVGEETETTAVWLDTEDWFFKPLTQIYTRLSATSYAYRSPMHDYSADLVTDGFGVIQAYPELWTAVPACPTA